MLLMKSKIVVMNNLTAKDTRHDSVTKSTGIGDPGSACGLCCGLDKSVKLFTNTNRTTKMSTYHFSSKQKL